MSNLELSLVIPVYNEAHVVQPTLEQLIPYLEQLGLEFEVVVVDDGSRDGTGLALAGIERKQPSLRVLTLDTNEGKGSALQRGVLAAEGKYIVTLDVDLSTQLEAIPRAIQSLADGTAVVFGDRHHGSTTITHRQAPLRERCGGLFNSLAHWLVWHQVRDFTCGFKAYRSEAAMLLYENLSIARWAYDVELFAVAKQHNLKVLGLPIHWHNHSDTRVRFPKDAFRALFDLLTVVVRQRTGAYSS